MEPSTITNPRVLPVIDLLRKKIREQGFTETEVANALSWRRRGFEDLKSGSRLLYVEDVFSILDAIGVEDQTFFTELYGPSPKSSTPPADLAGLSAVVDRIVELLIENGHFTAGELARASAAHAGPGPRLKAKARRAAAAKKPTGRPK